MKFSRVLINPKVKTSENKITNNTGRYFPQMIPLILIGCVNSHCSVFELSSSANKRMVSAGIMKSKIHGAIKKKLLREAVPVLKILNSLSKNHKNRLHINTKADAQT